VAVKTPVSAWENNIKVAISLGDRGRLIFLFI